MADLLPGILWIGGAVAALYAAWFAIVLAAMLARPERFGAFMSRVHPALVWGALPATRMWLWARRGALAVGDRAPDFSLPTLADRTHRVTLSSCRGDRPVVLVFGSYT